MRKLFWSVFALLVFFSGCRKEPVTWNPDLLVPLAYGKVDISDFIKEDYLTADANGVLFLNVREEFNEFAVDSVVNVLDTVLHNTFLLDLPFGSLTVPAGFSLFDIAENEELDADPVKMRILKIKSGTLNYQALNYFGAPINVNYSIPSVELAGNAYSVYDELVARNGSVPGVSSGSTDLAGAVFDLRGPGLNAFNVIQSVFNVTVGDAAGSGVEVSTSDSVVIDLAFQDVVIEYALGYFGQHEISDIRTISVDALNSISAELFELESASVILEVNNFTGIDISLKINELTAQRGLTTQPLQASTLNAPVQLARAFDNGFDIQNTSFQAAINSGNSAINEFIGLLPTQLILDYSLEINPLGDISGGHDFLYSDPNLEAVLDLSIPLCLAASGLVLRDTISIDENPNISATGDIIVLADNAFPFGASLGGKIINSVGGVLHTFSTGGAILPGLFQPSTGQTVAVKSTHNVSLGQSIGLLIPENRIVLEVRFDTYNYPEIVKVRSDAYLELSIIADVSAEIEVD